MEPAYIQGYDMQYHHNDDVIEDVSTMVFSPFWKSIGTDLVVTLIGHWCPFCMAFSYSGSKKKSEFKLNWYEMKSSLVHLVLKNIQLVD